MKDVMVYYSLLKTIKAYLHTLGSMVTFSYCFQSKRCSR